MLDINSLRESIIDETFISDILYLDEIDSTNNRAKDPALGDNILVVTEFQSSGKGRLQRIWQSEKGLNLLFTIRKQFEVRQGRAQSVNFFFSYFLAMGLEKFMKQNLGLKDTPGLKIKWPNDILFENKKLSGLLIDRKDERNFLIGIGLNVKQKSFPENLHAASLEQISGKEIDRTELLIHIIQVFNENMILLINGEYEKIHSLWAEKCRDIGQDVEFISPESSNIKKGRVITVLIDGGIVIRMAAGDNVYYSGDIKIPQ